MPTPPSALEAPPRAARKGRQTRAAIVQAALELAARTGVEGLTIGALATATGMSKSGVFAHFGSREELQIAVVEAYHARFEAEVFRPGLAVPRGLPRLRALVQGWLRRVSAEADAGCLYVSGAVEFDDQPGPVRDALVTMVAHWRAALARAVEQAIEAGHLPPDTDVPQLLFELHGLVLSLHHDARLLHNPQAAQLATAGFDRLMDHPPKRAS